jgi:hypothetical protein
MNSFAADLLKILQQVDRPGSFCVSGKAPPVLPGLEVQGLGTIGLPLGDAQAAELANLCHRERIWNTSRMLVLTLVKDIEIVGEAPTSGKSRQ